MRVIISYLGNFLGYHSHDPLETILGGRMRGERQKADRMMKICEIFDIFFDRTANYFECILTDIELWPLCQHLSGHRLTDGQNNMIPREKVTIKIQKVTLVLHSL
jgi:hypothetical protein